MTRNRPLPVLRRLGANLVRLVRRAFAGASLPQRAGFWLIVRLDDGLDELRSAAFPLGSPPSNSLFELLEALAAAARDPQVEGVLFKLGGPAHSLSRALSLRRAIVALRESGKPVAVHAEALEAESLLLATAASAVWLPETGSVHLVGLRLESLFLRGVLDRLDIQPEVVRIGRYKSAAERLTNETLSDANREQLEALADDLYAALVNGIAEGRGLDPDDVRALIDAGPYRAPRAAEVGLIDACLYPDELETALEGLMPAPTLADAGPRRVRCVEATAYVAVRSSTTAWRPIFAEVPRIAYVVARGMIKRGDGVRGIHSDRYRALFAELAADPNTRGVVLRIDSGGGDALASDLLWRSISLLAREKPVVVSMGDVVASGGYYMAAAADRIFAEAATITGSIGVVGGKVNVAGLYDRIGVSKQAIERGARAGMLAESRGFTPTEREALHGEMNALYETFVERVATGRGLATEAVHEVAQGRIWSGVRAQKVGLVDAIGGPLEALAAVRELAGLRAREFAQIVPYPYSPKFPSLRELLRHFSLG